MSSMTDSTAEGMMPLAAPLRMVTTAILSFKKRHRVLNRIDFSKRCGKHFKGAGWREGWLSALLPMYFSKADFKMLVES